MDETRPLEIYLLGQKVTLRAYDADPEKAKEVVHFVTEKLKEVEQKTQNLLSYQLVLLALLDLAEEYLNAKQRAVNWQKMLLQSSQQLLEWIELKIENEA